MKELLYGGAGFWKGAGGARFSGGTHPSPCRVPSGGDSPSAEPPWCPQPGAVAAGHRQKYEQCSQRGLGKYVFRDLLQQTALSQLILKAPLELLGSVV